MFPAITAGLLLTASVAAFGQSDPSLFTTVINLPVDIPSLPAGGFIDSDTQLNVYDGGMVGSSFSVGRPILPFSSNVEMNVFGGAVDSNLSVWSGSTLNILGGGIGVGMTAESGSFINIMGGTIGSNFLALPGSTVTMSGGSVGNQFRSAGIFDWSGGNATSLVIEAGGHAVISGSASAGLLDIDSGTADISGGLFNHTIVRSGSSAAMTGGTYGTWFDLHSGASASIAGGVFGGSFNVQAGSTLELIGGEFSLNGAGISELNAGVAGTDLFTGTLADGSVFIHTSQSVLGIGALDVIAASTTTLTNIAIAPADLEPIVISTGDGPAGGLRPGQHLTISGDAAVRNNFAAVGSVIHINGGAVNAGFEAAYTDITLNTGTIGQNSRIYAGSTLHIHGGSVQQGLRVLNGGEVRLHTGTIDSPTIDAGGSLTSTGGHVIGNLFVNAGRAELFGMSSVVTENIVMSSGGLLMQDGNVLGSVVAFANSTIELAGGTIHDELAVFGVSHASLTGGAVLGEINGAPGSTIEISGGTFTSGISTEGVLNISGGQIGSVFASGATSISGGQFLGNYLAFTGELNIIGTQFFLDGVEILGLAPGDSLVILDREVTLSGVLDDGGSFSFDLYETTSQFPFGDYVSEGVRVTITSTVPTPGGVVLVSMLGLAAIRRRRRTGSPR